MKNKQKQPVDFESTVVGVIWNVWILEKSEW